MLCPSCYLGIPSGCTARLDYNPEDGSYITCLDMQNSDVNESISVPAALSAEKKKQDAIFNTMDSGPKEIGAGGGRYKNAADLKSPARVGRQRANQIKPIKAGDICEWSMLKYAGGGPVPIIGCYNNPAQTVHHGPDKDYLNNEISNLHKICSTCHSHYHVKNDIFYVRDRPPAGTPFTWNTELVAGLEIKPHDPETKATLQEVFENIAEWKKVEIDTEVMEDDGAA